MALLHVTRVTGQQVPLPWQPAVLALKRQLEALCGCAFNSCLLNKYRSGEDSVGWHADNEAVYGEQPTIASISLGTTRDFDLRSMADKRRKARISLRAGDALIMCGSMQQHWQHCVPPRRGKWAAHQAPRISLTFRTILLAPRGGTAG